MHYYRTSATTPFDVGNTYLNIFKTQLLIKNRFKCSIIQKSTRRYRSTLNKSYAAMVTDGNRQYSWSKFPQKGISATFEAIRVCCVLLLYFICSKVFYIARKYYIFRTNYSTLSQYVYWMLSIFVRCKL